MDDHDDGDNTVVAVSGSVRIWKRIETERRLSKSGGGDNAALGHEPKRRSVER